MVDDSTEDLEDTVQAEPDTHTDTDDEPPPLCRVYPESRKRSNLPNLLEGQSRFFQLLAGRDLRFKI